MNMNRCKIVSLLLFCFAAALPAVAQDTSPVQAKADHYVILFEINDSDINSGFADNSKTLSQIDSVFNSPHFAHLPDSIAVIASSSFEGSQTRNRQVAQNRAARVWAYLRQTYPSMQSIPVGQQSIEEDFYGLKQMVKADPNVPCKEDLLSILNNQTITSEQKEAQIKSLCNGSSFRYLADNILAHQRKATVCVYYQPEEVVEEAPVPQVVVVEKTVIYVPEQPPVIATYKTCKPWAIKTNLLQWAVGVANIGVEIPIGDQFSVDVPFTYSPYTLARRWKLRVMGLQPEFRWWLNEQMNGHFVGVHAHAAYFNVAVNKKTRYQDKNGDTPLWGMGVSYGYAMPLCERWGMEFTLGAGYARIAYDKFNNVPNGAEYASKTKNYWGITRAGATLIYKFNW